MFIEYPVSVHIGLTFCLEYWEQGAICLSLQFCKWKGMTGCSTSPFLVSYGKHRIFHCCSPEHVVGQYGRKWFHKKCHNGFHWVHTGNTVVSSEDSTTHPTERAAPSITSALGEIELPSLRQRTSEGSRNASANDDTH
eukprot:gb/GECG01009577.1/.p1 GENE.gb/GECG01009577.1/~~gb/GECG01009577.1/.p1  ORF type:complete len:138 (+),score=6.62 gb/GECG01009577.1/:1-414(+)